jgi:hypothetical protein
VPCVWLLNGVEFYGPDTRDSDESQNGCTPNEFGAYVNAAEFIRQYPNWGERRTSNSGHQAEVMQREGQLAAELPFSGATGDHRAGAAHAAGHAEDKLEAGARLAEPFRWRTAVLRRRATSRARRHDCVCICYAAYAHIDFEVTFIRDDRLNRFGSRALCVNAP